MAEPTQHPTVADRSRLGNGMNDAATHTDNHNDLIRADHQSIGLQYLVLIVLACWLLIVLVLGARGAFVVPAGTPPYPIAIGGSSHLSLCFLPRSGCPPPSGVS
jgi:hypothetical protein